jgi:uncharacterized protein with NRDE domain
MCTVTYIPPSSRHGFILTSNRDERDFRPTLPPATYLHNNKRLGYPKDERAGGSWIAVNGNGRISCLLNGAYLAHKKQDFHTMSRGMVLLELVSSDIPVKEFFLTKVLENVEPFTIVTVDGDGGSNSFNEFVWDGINKYVSELDKDVPRIWSSITLYNEEQRMLRKDWFNRFHMSSGNDMSPAKVLSFHTGMHTPDESVNVVMNRAGGMKTVSITQITSEKGKIIMLYADLLNNSNHQLFL